MISKIRYASEINDNQKLEKAKSLAKFQSDLVEKRRMGGDKHLHFLNGGSLLGESADECTVDGVHPTDFGFYMMANRIAPAITAILD